MTTYEAQLGVGALRARARPSTPTPLGARTLRVLGNHRPQGAGAPSLPKPFRARTLRAIQIKHPQGAGAPLCPAPLGARTLRAPHPRRTLRKGAGVARALVLAWFTSLQPTS